MQLIHDLITDGNFDIELPSCPEPKRPACWYQRFCDFNDEEWKSAVAEIQNYHERCASYQSVYEQNRQTVLRNFFDALAKEYQVHSKYGYRASLGVLENTVWKIINENVDYQDADWRKKLHACVHVYSCILSMM
jgi:hypothetical protein